MKYLPYDNFYIDTPLKPDEVYQMLEKEVSPPSRKFLSFGKSTRGTYFMGYILNDEFKFEPEIAGRNSFNPQITGSITTHQNGSRVIIKMHLQIGVLVFLSFAIFFILIGCLSIVMSEITEGEVKWSDFIPLLMLLFIYLLTTLSYKSESTPAKEKLINLLHGKLIQIK